MTFPGPSFQIMHGGLPDAGMIVKCPRYSNETYPTYDQDELLKTAF